MDKEQRKKLSQEYKKKELEKELISEDPIIANWAKLRLGLTSDPLTQKDILTIPDNELVKFIYTKIQEIAEKKYRENPKSTKSSENVINNLPAHYKQLFYTYEFEMLLENGDCDKFLDNTSIEEIQTVAEFYQILGFDSLSKNILIADDEEIVELIEVEFNSAKSDINKKRVEFIRQNAENFQVS